MSYRLFLDDERYPADTSYNIAWVVVRSSAEAITFCEQHGLPVHISFDHDLGGSDTAMRFVHWLQNFLVDLDHGRPFTYAVHSQNPVGAANIIGTWDSFDRIYVPLIGENK